jgi:hypothetical protein
MLTIRTAQLHRLATVREEELADRLAEHLREHFTALAAVEPSALRARAEEVLASGTRMGLETERSLYQHANLCAVLGWDYIDRPENAWMRERYLDEPRLGAPADRMRQLLDQCVWRIEVEEHNARLRS